MLKLLMCFQHISCVSILNIIFLTHLLDKLLSIHVSEQINRYHSQGSMCMYMLGCVCVCPCRIL